VAFPISEFIRRRRRRGRRKRRKIILYLNGCFCRDFTYI